MKEAESLEKKALRLCVLRNWQLHQAEELVQYFVVLLQRTVLPCFVL